MEQFNRELLYTIERLMEEHQGKANLPEILDEISYENKSWGILYHLSSQRSNILSMMEIHEDDHVLLLHAETGSLSYGLSDLVESGRLTFYEPDPLMARICDLRMSGRENAHAFKGDLDELDQKYDLIVLNHSLEREGDLVLSKAWSHLKTGGRLYLICDNARGMKSWNGIKGDMAYSYSKKELEDKISTLNSSYKFYYPYPDANFTKATFTDERLPLKGELSVGKEIRGAYYTENFDEARRMEEVLSDGMFPYFANSYVVEIRRGGKESDLIYSKAASNRRLAFAIYTNIYKSRLGLRTIKGALFEEGIEQMDRLVASYDSLRTTYSGTEVTIPRVERRDDMTCLLDFAEGRSFDEILDESLEHGMLAQVSTQMIEMLEELLVPLGLEGSAQEFIPDEECMRFFGPVSLNHPMHVASGLDMDSVFSNVIVTKTGYALIDYEWTYTFPLPIEFLVYRAVKTYVEQNEKRSAFDPTEVYAHFAITEEDIQAFASMEAYFQEVVYDKTRSIDSILYRRDYPKASLPDAYEKIAPELDAAKLQLQQLKIYKWQANHKQQEIDYLSHRMRGMEETRTWKMRSGLVSGLRRCLGRKSQDDLEKEHQAMREVRYLDLPVAKEAPGRIAVHLHLYYEDLLEEMLLYIDHIPYAYDLFISVREDAPCEELERRCRNATRHMAGLTIRPMRNRGRDIAPLYVGFREEMLQYDFLCHVHTKHSLHRRDGDLWRHYCMESILGSEELVSHIFGLFAEGNPIFTEDDNRKSKMPGLIYPEFYYDLNMDMACWGDNLSYGKRFQEEYGIVDEASIFPFPAGSFFFARVDAIRPIFERAYTIEDFEEEAGQVDNTLAHVLERGIHSLSESRGYQDVILDMAEGVARFRLSRKNFLDYMQTDLAMVRPLLEEYDLLSFNLFDTLVSTGRFHTSWNTILEDLAPREEMLSLYEDALASGKKVLLLCDGPWSEMDAGTDHDLSCDSGRLSFIHEILDKCKMSAPSKIILLQGRPREIWDKIYDPYGIARKCHIGSDIHLDYHNLVCYNREALFVMREQDMYICSDLFDYEPVSIDISEEENRRIGQLMHEYFHSPFASLSIRRF